METTASIIAVIQLCEKVIKYINAVSEAKEEKRRLRSQIRACSNLLLALKDGAEDSEEVGEWSTTLRLLATPLARFQEALSLAAVALSAPDGIRGKLRWPFKEKDVAKLIDAIKCEMAMVSLALEHDSTRLLVEITARSKRNEQLLMDVKDTLESRIEETCSTVQQLSGELQTIQETQNGVWRRIEDLHGRQDTEASLRERQRILEWLSPIDHASEQRDAISRRQAGTGGWLLNSQAYQDWLSTDGRTLFCPGIPGAGKTVFASIINADLWERHHHDPTVGLAYLFCNYRRQDEQTLEALLSSILKQLVERQVYLPKSVENLYESQQKGGSNRIDATTRALESVMATYSRVFVVIDALDECSVSRGCRTGLLSRIQTLQKQCHINILATSRFIPEIAERFNTAFQLEIQADSNDVRRYLAENTSRLPSFVQRDTELQEEIVSKIVEAVRGMFLLAKLHLDSLIGKRAAKAVRVALGRLATGSEAYDSAYGSAMKRIEGQIGDQAELAKQALAFLTCARRPLSAQELREALGVEIGESALDPDNYPDIQDVLSSCLGLVTVNEDSGIIQLVHYTTQEYLERTLDCWFPDAEAMITNVCTSYLSLDRYADPARLNRSEDNDWYDYSVRYWLDHARLAPSSIAQIVNFLARQINVVKSTFHLKKGWRPAPFYEGDYPETNWHWTTGLHLAIELGLEAATVALLKQGFEIHVRNGQRCTPLITAAIFGQAGIVGQLVKYDYSLDEAITDGGTYTPGCTALHIAALNDFDNIVRILIEGGATVDSRDANGETPLHYAVIRGATNAAKVLLVAKADMAPTLWSWPADNFYPQIFREYRLQRSILSMAVMVHSVDMVMLVLEAGVDVNEKEDSTHTTALFYAAQAQGNGVLAKVLLDAGADPNIASCDGSTPLKMACQDHTEEDFSTVRILLDAGAKIDFMDNDGYTAYDIAKKHNKVEIAQYLLERGADPELGLRHRSDASNESRDTCQSSGDCLPIVSNEEKASLLICRAMTSGRYVVLERHMVSGRHMESAEEQ